MAKPRCGKISQASRANSWRRMFSCPTRRRSTKRPAYDAASGRVFKPATLKEVGGMRVAVIGQAFPYVPIAHPKRFTPDWTFGIREQELLRLVDDLRNTQHADVIVLLSHNGMDVDLKLASRCTGINIIL